MPPTAGHACARIGLAGNPSDGFGGRCVAFAIQNFHAEVALGAAAPPSATQRWDALAELQADAARPHGLRSGAARLLLAARAVFAAHLRETDAGALRDAFPIALRSSIPYRLGLSGSSAIIIAALRALAALHHLALPPPRLARLAWEAEARELGIPCGLQDRIAQAWERPVWMDLAPALIDDRGCGRVEPIAADLLPPLFLAFNAALDESSAVLHGDLRARWQTGDAAVHAAVERWAAIADAVRSALLAGRGGEIGPLLDENFDLRAEICGTGVSAGNHAAVAAARSTGASAKFAGSGGALVGTLPADAAPERALPRLRTALEPLGWHVSMVHPAEGALSPAGRKFGPPISKSLS